MPELKHSFNLKAKHQLLLSPVCSPHNKAMLNNESQDDAYRKELASRVREAIASLGRGGKTRIAKECDVSPQAITGWERNGRVDKSNLAIVSGITGFNLNWLITGDHIEGSTLPAPGNVEPGPMLGEFSAVPVVGSAQLGDNGHWSELEYPVGNGDGYISYPTRDRNAYALRCVGDSMRPRIREGEFVIIEPNSEAVPGDEVLLKTLDGRVMIKTLLYQRDGKIHVMSVNEAHPPQSFDLASIDKVHPVAAIVKKALWAKGE